MSPVELAIDVHQPVGIGEQLSSTGGPALNRRREAALAQQCQIGVMPFLDTRSGEARGKKASELLAPRRALLRRQAGGELLKALGVGGERHQAASSQP